MHKTAVDKLAKAIGFDIGNSDDIAQSDLLNGLCDGLKLMGSRDRNMQICYLSDKLTPSTKAVLLEIAEYCE